MTAKYFVDTNLLVYARDGRDPNKKQRAITWLDYLWQSRCGALSYQVLQEYYQTVTRRLNPRLDANIASADIRDLMTWRPIIVDLSVLERAWLVEERYKLSWWDSLIAGAALHGGCSYLLTEDLRHGQKIDELLIQNPFLVPPPAIQA